MKHIALPEHMYDGDIRAPVPYPSYEDFRDALLAASAAGALRNELERIYRGSSEVATLARVFGMNAGVHEPLHRELALRIENSRKYTRVHFPNCPKLTLQIHGALDFCGYSRDIRDSYDGITRQVCIVRTGIPDEIIYPKEPN